MATTPGAATGRRRPVTFRQSTPLPIRDGVAAGRLVLPDGHWPLLLDFLVERFRTLSRAEISARMRNGDITDADGISLPADHPHIPNLVVHYYRALAVEELIPFKEVVLYQDERLVVVDKPHFLPVNPSGRYLQETLLIRLIRTLGIETLTPMHRLDRETAGVMLFCVQPHLRGVYQNLFKDRAVKKLYDAIAPYRPGLELPLSRHTRLVPGEPFMRMRETRPNETGAVNAHTAIELIRILPKETHALYRLAPETGKKHQLRVHMAALGIPIVNDTIYPEALSREQIAALGHTAPLQLLARSIRFTDPVTGKDLYFESQRTLDHATL